MAQLRVTIVVTDEVEDDDYAGLMALIDPTAEAILKVDGFSLGGRIEGWRVDPGKAHRLLVEND